MPPINPGRLTVRRDAPFVVFIIGMRVNKPLAITQWWPVFSAMPRMLKELGQHPELGCLGASSWFGRTIIVVQYWRSLEELMAYAKARDHAHLPAWAAFNQNAKDNGAVGIYHETYRIEPGATENIYNNIPPTLLGKVGPLVPAEGIFMSAAGRMGRAEIGGS